MLNALFGLNPQYNLAYKTGRSRIMNYMRFKRLYDGFMVRDNLSSTVQFKKLKYNPATSIINIGAEFLASEPITFQVDNDPVLTQACNDIWARSGGSNAFMENAVLGSIQGDAAILVQRNDDDEVYLHWFDAAVCFPIFDNTNYEKIVSFIIAYQIPDQTQDGAMFTYFEEWKDGIVTKNENGVTSTIGSYDESRFGGIPAVWIRNITVKGEMYGRSDIYPIIELVEEYDHLMSKQTRIIDYYANPNLYMKGVKKTDTVAKDEKTIYFIPTDGDIGFIEWKGTPQSVDTQLQRVKASIGEISATPEISFSDFSLKTTNLSGIAMKVMFGPLLKKTARKQLSWGCGICKAMQLALIEEGHRKVTMDELNIIWMSPLPNNTKEDWEASVMKNLLGVSFEQIQREQGYNQAQIDQIKAEKREEEMQAVEMAALTAQASMVDQVANGARGAAQGGQNAKGSGDVGPKAMSAKQKADHVGSITPGKLGVRTTGQSDV